MTMRRQHAGDAQQEEEENLGLDLEKAAENDDLASVRAILESKCHVHQLYLDKALMKAACRGHADMVRLMMTKGASCDLPDEHGNTALILAAERGHAQVTALLLENGASVNRTDTHTRSSLHWACMNGHSCVVRQLLQHQAAPDEQDQFYGFTPLMLAARHGHLSIVKLLLDHCCDPNKQDRNGETALFDAAVNNKVACMELLLEAGANVNKQDQFGHTPLLAAVLRNRVAAVRLLLQANCDLDVKSPVTYIVGSRHSELRVSPLETAMFEGHLTICQLLVEAGTDINVIFQHLNDDVFRLPFMVFGGGNQEQTTKWLRRRACHPQSIKQLCRNVIRRQLGTALSNSLPHLGLPSALQKYLLIPSLDSIGRDDMNHPTL